MHEVPALFFFKTLLEAYSDPPDSRSSKSTPMLDAPAKPMLEIPASFFFTTLLATYSVPTDSGSLQKYAWINTLDLHSILTMLDVPAHNTLDALAPQSPAMDAPADQVYVTRSDNLSWSPGRADYGPSNPHDPGPSGADADRFEVGTQSILSSMATNRSPLWTTSSFDFGPSNPHDPGPSAAVADCIISVFTNLASLIIANYVVVDFLFIPPRSPSVVYIVL